MDFAFQTLGFGNWVSRFQGGFLKTLWVHDCDSLRLN